MSYHKQDWIALATKPVPLWASVAAVLVSLVLGAWL